MRRWTLRVAHHLGIGGSHSLQVIPSMMESGRWQHRFLFVQVFAHRARQRPDHKRRISRRPIGFAVSSISFSMHLLLSMLKQHQPVCFMFFWIRLRSVLWWLKLQGMYSASKAALASYTDSLCVEMRRHRIRVCLFEPVFFPLCCVFGFRVFQLPFYQSAFAGWYETRAANYVRWNHRVRQGCHASARLDMLLTCSIAILSRCLLALNPAL